jgi:restriction system protein
VNVTTTRASLLDQLIELVGIKSGLVLHEEDIVRLLEKERDARSQFRPGPWWRGDLDEFVRLRAEAIEADYTHVLHEVGALPDARTSTEITLQYMRDQLGERRLNSLEDYFAVTTLPPELQEEHDRRFLLNRDLPESRSWDGVIPLSDLFDSEAAPQGSAGNFDQRYIDYLNAQESDLSRIHWRQFEHLTAEFFSRNGYAVTVTPPRGDGGVDVIARREAELTGPELILIQCKRYGAKGSVKIDEVKAFWATLDDTHATRGLIATTSRLELGARRFCEARRYRLTAAEAPQVREWLRQLASPESGRGIEPGARGR